MKLNVFLWFLKSADFHVKFHMHHYAYGYSRKRPILSQIAMFELNQPMLSPNNSLVHITEEHWQSLGGILQCFMFLLSWPAVLLVFELQGIFWWQFFIFEILFLKFLSSLNLVLGHIPGKPGLRVRRGTEASEMWIIPE